MSSQPDVLFISCDTCVMASTSACDDCMMNVICQDTGHDAIVLDIDELQAIQLLGQAGMVPTLRHRDVG